MRLICDLTPHVSDGVSLGTGSLMFSDLFLASGSVVNFNNGDMTITHASNCACDDALTTARASSSNSSADSIMPRDDLCL